VFLVLIALRPAGFPAACTKGEHNETGAGIQRKKTARVQKNNGARERRHQAAGAIMFSH